MPKIITPPSCSMQIIRPPTVYNTFEVFSKTNDKKVYVIFIFLNKNILLKLGKIWKSFPKLKSEFMFNLYGI